MMTNQERIESINEVRKRISDYLASGGLFNPELADHSAVRDLIIDADIALVACEVGLQSTPPRGQHER